MIPIQYKCKHCQREETILAEIGAKAANHRPCKCPKAMTRATSDREIVRLERAATCRPSNEAYERRMRHCESCEVPIGIMTRRWFWERYVLNEWSCPTCGQPAVYQAYGWAA